MDVRVLAWSQVLVEDAVYFLHYIKNDGTKDIKKVGVTLWYADFVGAMGIHKMIFRNLIYWKILHGRDADHKAPLFGNDPVGIVAVALETPGNAVDRIDNDGDSPENGRLYQRKCWLVKFRIIKLMITVMD